MELTVPDILLMAKQHEIEELRQLQTKAELVGVAGHMLHMLQYERGASSMYLASAGQRFGPEREALLEESRRIEQELRQAFRAQLEKKGADSTKLLSLMAWVLLGLDALPELRQQITDQKLPAHKAVLAFTRLIAGLVPLIFAIAESATHPRISQSLVAFFNLVQGKEQAGLERALGALCFASGCCDGAHQQRILQLIEAQERSFQAFEELADARARQRWLDAQSANFMVPFERLRRILSTTGPGQVLDANLSYQWFECCSARLESIWIIQCSLLETMTAQCRELLKEAEQDLDDSEGLLRKLQENPPPLTGLVDRFFDPRGPMGEAAHFLPEGVHFEGMGTPLIELLQTQTERLSSMETELEQVRRSLNERKVIERAKGMIMARCNMSEESAYKTLRKTAMDQHRRLIDIAEAALALPDLVLNSQQTHH